MHPSHIDSLALRTDPLELPRGSWLSILSDARMQALLRSGISPLILTDADGIILYFNLLAEKLCGWTSKDVLGLPITDLISPDDKGALSEVLQSSTPRKGTFSSREIQCYALHRKGEPIPVQMRVTTGTQEDRRFHCCTLHNLDEVRLTQDRLQRLADHDHLTGLFNRRRFYEELERHMELSDRYDSGGSLLFVDLDDFKEINDTLGHACGDAVLKHVAKVLQDRTRKTDIVGRLGGDEFAVLLTRTPPEVAIKVGDDICQALRKESARADSREVSITVSIGVAAFPEHATRPKQLFAGADAAMYHSKDLGRNCATLYSPDMNRANVGNRRIVWEERIRKALARDLFFLVLQPIKPLTDGLCPKYESLIRMHSDEGALSPGDFLPIAERYGLIVDIDRWVLQRVLKGLATASPGLYPSVSVNLSSRACGHQGILQDLRDARDSGLVDPSRITLEITESAMISDFELAKEFLREVSALGFRLAIDDFGTGFSSLARLRELNVDYLKVDIVFVREVAHSARDQHLIRAMASLAKDLGQMTIAEGVEDLETLEILRELGVDYAQGYHVGRPAETKGF